MLSQDENKKVPEEEFAGFGGYTTRHRYEQSREKKKRRRWRIAYVALVVVLLIPAVFGVISLVRGDFFPKEKSPEQNGTIRVPTGNQLNQTPKEPDQMIEEMGVSLAVVELERQDGTLSYASGFVISDDGFLLSSLLPVQEEWKQIRVHVEGISYTATVQGAKTELGFSVLKLSDALGLIPVTVGNFSFVKRGEELFCIGGVYGKEFLGTALSGMVSSIGPSVRVGEGESAHTVSLAYLDVSPNASVFGAPVTDAAGNTVGICVDLGPSAYGEYLTVLPINTIYTLVNEMLMQ